MTTPDSTPPDSTPPDSPGEALLDAAAWAEQGIQFCRKARWKDAIDPLRHAVELEPEHQTAHFYLGEAYNHTDELPAALAAFEAAVRANPTFWRAFKGIGIVLDRLRRPQEAAAAYQRARELHRGAAPRAGAE